MTSWWLRGDGDCHRVPLGLAVPPGAAERVRQWWREPLPAPPRVNPPRPSAQHQFGDHAQRAGRGGERVDHEFKSKLGRTLFWIIVFWLVWTVLVALVLFA